MHTCRAHQDIRVLVVGGNMEEGGIHVVHRLCMVVVEGVEIW
jgi:hypothetical protein